MKPQVTNSKNEIIYRLVIIFYMTQINICMKN